MPLSVKINVALREQNCQKIGSERVKYIHNKITVVFRTLFRTLYFPKKSLGKMIWKKRVPLFDWDWQCIPIKNGIIVKI